MSFVSDSALVKSILVGDPPAGAGVPVERVKADAEKPADGAISIGNDLFVCCVFISFLGIGSSQFLNAKSSSLIGVTTTTCDNKFLARTTEFIHSKLVSNPRITFFEAGEVQANNNLFYWTLIYDVR